MFVHLNLTHVLYQREELPTLKFIAITNKQTHEDQKTACALDSIAGRGA